MSQKIPERVYVLVDELVEEYMQGDDCMGDLLASIPVHSFNFPYTFEDIYLAYCLAMNKIEEDEFYVKQEGEMIEVVV